MHEARREGAAHELPPWLWLWAPVATMVALLGTRLVAPSFYLSVLDPKEGPIEWVTVLILPLAVVAGVGVLRERDRLPAPWLRGWVAAVTLGAAYFAGEEISWGQTLIGWESPEFFQRFNDQGETNLHNMSNWLDQKPRTVVELWVLTGGLVVPLWLRDRWAPAAHDWRRWFWPTRVCVPTAVLALAVRIPDRLERPFGDLTFPAPFDIRASEPQELYFAFFMLLYLSSLRVRLARRETPHA